MFFYAVPRIAVVGIACPTPPKTPVARLRFACELALDFSTDTSTTAALVAA